VVDLERLKQSWDELGRSDPLWAVLTWPGKRGGRWEADEFFALGVSEVAELMEYVRSLGLSPGKGRALDFGCGVGRCTQALAAHFEEVWGVDIAPSMIEWAERFNRYGERCRYRVDDSPDLSRFPDGHFDFVYSKLTLQHIPPRYAKGFIREFLRVLHRDGVCVFQVAGQTTVARRAAVRAVRRFLRRLVPEALIYGYRKLRYGHLIEMYGMPREEAERTIEEGGGWTSHRYCVTKE
jgi:ubiquinone/menaquinone biosynthesis C-methylase UbiE